MYIPLWESLVTADMPTFAGLTTLPRLGVTATMRTTTGTCHDGLRRISFTALKQKKKKTLQGMQKGECYVRES